MDTNRIIVVANTNGKYEESNRVYSSEGIVATLKARDYKGPKTILELQPSIHGPSIIGTKEEFKTAVLPVVEPNVLTPKRTEYGKAIRKDYEKGLIKESRHNMVELQPRTDGVSNTLTTVQKDNYAVEPPGYHIRKLTPKECWRLMGCSDEDFHKAEQVNSNTQLYKQAGNAIVVDVLEAIFSKLFLK